MLGLIRRAQIVQIESERLATRSLYTGDRHQHDSHFRPAPTLGLISFCSGGHFGASPLGKSLILREVRDQSLITGMGGGCKMKKIVGPKLVCGPPPLPQDRVKPFLHPLLKGGNLLHPAFSMGNTSRFCVKTTPKLCVASLQQV